MTFKEIVSRHSYRGLVSVCGLDCPVSFSNKKLLVTLNGQPGARLGDILAQLEQVFLLHPTITLEVIVHHSVAQRVKKEYEGRYFVETRGRVANIYKWSGINFPGGRGNVKLVPKVLACGEATTVVEDGNLWDKPFEPTNLKD